VQEVVHCQSDEPYPSLERFNPFVILEGVRASAYGKAEKEREKKLRR
jgi:hypothetical protein